MHGSYTSDGQGKTGAEDAAAVFHAHDVSRIYPMGEVEVQALRSVTLDLYEAVWEGNDVLKVPASALFRRGQDWSVFVVEDSRARVRTVEIGHRNALEAELVKGLGEGVEVILHPGNQLSEGTRVSQ